MTPLVRARRAVDAMHVALLEVEARCIVRRAMAAAEAELVTVPLVAAIRPEPWGPVRALSEREV